MTSPTMWGGRFQSGPSQLMRRFNDSFRFDRELLSQEIAASIGWAKALAAASVLTSEERDAMVAALLRVASAGVPRTADDSEDIHSFVEARLHDHIGSAASRLHSGRSRNDQVATDLRLWLLAACGEAIDLADSLAVSLATLARSEGATPMPGYTHLKQAEPVTFGHWCLAYVEMLARDSSRLHDARARGDECPLGSGALSGTPLPIDRQLLAESLGFRRPTANSLDAVSDRDLAAEYLFVSSLLLGHLSRLAEDLIFFTSDEVAMMELPDSMATGSSRMPQKKNPDVLELVRGHAGRSIGELTGLLAVLKGLPLAYDKDLQLDKEPLFRTRNILSAALPSLGALLEGLVLNRPRMRALASRDLLLATELADAMAARGVPFREAHRITGERVAEAISRGKTLRELGPSETIMANDLLALDVDRALAKRSCLGGTSPERVGEAADAALKRLMKKDKRESFGEAAS